MTPLPRATGRRRVAIRRAALAVAAAGLLAGATACSSEPDGPELSVSGAFVPEPVSEAVAGGFLVLENTGGEDDALVGAVSEMAEKVELHETVENSMRPVDSLAVPAGGSLELARGGNHLMLHGLTHKPVEGDTVPIELTFEKSGTLTIDVPVASATHTGR
ncbi:copper chaperone PCu(A)C [Streptomyces spiramenti]|uniref:copper chaperone PCu(A)C n=1 Tax=Streptomyces spiramenti TaxID=2720606 RepID=UPI0030846902